MTIKLPLPFLSILGLIFITLKLTGSIAWSWVWVLAPFWLPLALFLLFLGVTFVVLLIVELGK